MVSIGNSMVSRAIWKKHARVRFSKTIKDFEVLEKTHECVFFQIVREIMLLPINNIHENSNTLPKKG